MRVILILALALSLSGCQDDPPPRPKDRTAEIEAARREREAVRQSEDRRSHYQTLRAIGFMVLAGGAVFLLVWIDTEERRAGYVGNGSQVARPVDRNPRSSGARVIEVPEPSPPPNNRRS